MDSKVYLPNMNCCTNPSGEQHEERQKTWICLRMAAALMIPLLLLLFIHCESYYLELSIILGSFAVSVWIATGTSALYGKLGKCVCILIGIAVIACAAVISLWPSINSCNMPDNSCRNPGFKGKVLLLVPHQDDELNVLGGALEYIAKDCETFVLYSTNGETARVQEAKNALSVFGINVEHICFLGYDRIAWKSSLQHMYNAPRNKVTVSEEFGRNATLSMPGTPCYKEGRPFTQANFEDDLQDYLTHLHPNVIIVTDFDVHPDHRALGLSTERVLARMMQAEPTYRPTVLKSFAYSCSWLQKPDFYADNLKSTQYTGNGYNMEEVNCYRWDERLRIPVGKSSVTRSLVGNLTAQAFNEHVSQQKANVNTNERICNGDKVFWWRPTRNLMWMAHITAESGDATQLNDFLLYDSDNVTDFEHMPYEHGWRPRDGKGKANVTWDSPAIVREIHLFDQNNPANQIKHLTIRLDNGKELSVGPLPAGGSRVVVPTGCSEPISGFTVSIDASTGEGSGLAEIEAYAESPEPPFQVAKLQDANGDFMYDYTTAPDGELAFSLYTWGCNTARLKVQIGETTSDGVALRQTKNGYRLQVPQGEGCILEVRDTNGSVLDAARVSNPGQFVRACRRGMQSFDPIMVSLSWENQRHYYTALAAWLAGFLP